MDMNITDKKKFPLWAAVWCIALAVLGRAVGILYSNLATNVVYADSFFCLMLPTLRQLLFDLCFAVSAGAVMACYLKKIPSRPVYITYAAVVFADGAAAIIIDVLSGVFMYDPARLILGIVYRLGLALYFAVMLLLSTAIGKAMLKRGGAVGISVTVAAVLPAAVDLISVMWKSLSALIEVDFMPYPDEVYTILFEIGVVLLTGVLSAIIAVTAVNRAKK